MRGLNEISQSSNIFSFRFEMFKTLLCDCKKLTLANEKWQGNATMDSLWFGERTSCLILMVLSPLSLSIFLLMNYFFHKSQMQLLSGTGRGLPCDHTLFLQVAEKKQALEVGVKIVPCTSL